MQTTTRLPKLTGTTHDGARAWFSELQRKGLLFHPEDDPDTIFQIADNQKTFSSAEAAVLRLVLGEIETAIGHDQMIGAACPVFMRAMGATPDA